MFEVRIGFGLSDLFVLIEENGFFTPYSSFFSAIIVFDFSLTVFFRI